ncbi:MAG: transcriptional regulator [Gammaproteobacteria bacterium]
MPADTSRSPRQPARDTPPFLLGAWRVEPETGRIRQGDTEASLEPRLMALLTLLASAPGRVFSREVIESALWPDVVVGEDTVARAVSRLRRALGDSVQSPRYIETLPRRGYRLIPTVSPLGTTGAPTLPARRLGPALVLAGLAIAVALLWFALRPPPPDDAATHGMDAHARQVARADDLYMRFTRADNEAAIGLYERVLAEAPDNPAALAGLANALVQRVVRWPFPPGSGGKGASSLSEALDRGLTRTPEGGAALARAVAVAERAVRLAPDDPDALKASRSSLSMATPGLHSSTWGRSSRSGAMPRAP